MPVQPKGGGGKARGLDSVLALGADVEKRCPVEEHLDSYCINGQTELRERWRRWGQISTVLTSTCSVKLWAEGCRFKKKELKLAGRMKIMLIIMSVKLIVNQKQITLTCNWVFTKPRPPYLLLLHLSSCLFSISFVAGYCQFWSAACWLADETSIPKNIIKCYKWVQECAIKMTTLLIVCTYWPKLKS